MLFSFIIWMVIGVVLQMVAGIYLGYLQGILDIDKQWTMSYGTFEKLCEINPFGKLFVMEKIKSSGRITIKSVSIFVISNLTSVFLWPVFVPMLLKYETKALKRNSEKKTEES